ncbi:hypothetical protein ACFQZI_09985 [Mucilaginibacter lutimaris]|uniref:MG2 domain-containing protein n=1 Tax=Mucilaginibacter lutimaris TaxID=931629 RepID=A0ABW2ZG72_9SPHI
MDKFCLRLFICILFLSVSSCPSWAQRQADPSENIINKIDLYALKMQAPVLFVHFDKGIYTNNEEAWFTGYLISQDTAEVRKHRIMSVSLINNDDSKIAAQANFIMDGGVSFGNMYIPDTVAAGNYHFVVYTDRLANGKPGAMFKQSVTIKTLREPAFNLSLKLVDSSQTPPGKINTLLTAKAKDIPLLEAPVRYKIGRAKKEVALSTGKTGVTGEHLLSIDKQLVSPQNNVLSAEVGLGKQKETISLVLPSRKGRLSVKFYPEGGSLIAGKPSKIGWEVKGPGNEPLKMRGVVLRNGMPVDTIETDSYGMGIFTLTPKKDALYQVKISSKGLIDTMCALPKALAKGVTINVADGITTGEVNIKLQSNGIRTVRILVHNYREILSSLEAEIPAKGLSAQIPTLDMPRGLTTITVLDSLDNPLAERVFFAHYDKRPDFEVTVDQKEFATRQKVKLNLKLGNNAGNLVNGYVSVACVQDNRLSYKHVNNIESYYYLTSQLQPMPLKNNLLGNDAGDKDYLNKVLLIKGWSRYTWPDMIKTEAGDTLKTYSNVAYYGDVTFSNNPLKKPIQLSAIADTVAQIINTDNTGHFVMNPYSMVTPADKKMTMFINAKAKTDPYVIHFNNPFEGMSQRMADTMSFYTAAVGLHSNDELVLKDNGKPRQLKEVKIKATKDNQLFASLPQYKSETDFTRNECGDWKCHNNILNCGNHPGDNGLYPLKKGDNVLAFRNGKYVSIIYRGCVIFKPKEYTSMLQMKGIYAHKEFYVVDFDANKNNPPEYQSTIFWKHNVPVSSNGETNLSFFTDDVTGPFRVIVQGVTDNDVIYGEQTFSVKKAQP